MGETISHTLKPNCGNNTEQRQQQQNKMNRACELTVNLKLMQIKSNEFINLETWQSLSLYFICSTVRVFSMILLAQTNSMN